MTICADYRSALQCLQTKKLFGIPKTHIEVKSDFLNIFNPVFKGSMTRLYERLFAARSTFGTSG